MEAGHALASKKGSSKSYEDFSPECAEGATVDYLWCWIAKELAYEKQYTFQEFT